MPKSPVERLIAASSLGTPEAVALRAGVSDETARRIVERSQQLNAGGEHVYLSTACLHGQHEHCRSAVAVDGGIKEPGTCKFCGAACVCPACDHTNADQT